MMEHKDMEELKEGWKRVKLGKVCETIFSGGTPNTKTSEYWDGNINWLSSGETRNRYIKNTEKMITKKGTENSSTKLALKNDIVVASAGQGFTRGQASYCLINTYINQSVISLRANPKIIDPKYLFFNISSRYNELRHFSDGNASRGSLTTKIMKELDIDLPPLETQQKIATILSSLDDKIELNNEMNKTLEEMAQTLFKRWFIDFEFPNENGEPYKSSGGKMVESELGEIPEGWEVGTLGEQLKITMGQSPSGTSYNEEKKGMIFYQGRTDFSFRFPQERMYTTEPKRIAKKKDVLMSVRAPVGDINIANNECCIGRGLAAIESEFSSYAFYLMKNLKNKFAVYNGEGTVFGSITKKDLENIPVITPKNEILEKFNEVISKLDDKIFINSEEIQSLTQIRDTLLPKLMSGEVEV